MKNSIAVIASIALVAACATAPNQISAQYVSPMIYQGLDCSQMQAEAGRINARVAEVTGQQQQAANNDATMMTVGLVLFWPALFFLQGDKAKTAELSRLKGEADALQQAYIQKGCATATPPKPASPASGQ